MLGASTAQRQQEKQGEKEGMKEKISHEEGTASASLLIMHILTGASHDWHQHSAALEAGRDYVQFCLQKCLQKQ